MRRRWRANLTHAPRNRSVKDSELPARSRPPSARRPPRDVARAILATPAIKRAVEPMLKLAVQSVKTMSATNRPVPVPRMDREPEPSL